MLPAIFLIKHFKYAFKKEKICFFHNEQEIESLFATRREKKWKNTFLIFLFQILGASAWGLLFLHNDIAQMQTMSQRCDNIVTSFFWSGTSPSSVYKISILTFLILCTKFLFHIFFLQLLGYLRSDRLNHHDLFLSAEEEPELVDHHLNDVLEVRPHGFEFPQIAELVL